MTVYDFPLRADVGPQKMSITLGTVEYKIRFYYANVPDGGWFMDVRDLSDDPLVLGLALTAGENVVQQFDYLGFEGGIGVCVDFDYTLEPTYDNFGKNGKVQFITDADLFFSDIIPPYVYTTNASSTTILASSTLVLASLV